MSGSLVVFFVVVVSVVVVVMAQKILTHVRSVFLIDHLVVDKRFYP